jgi:hypothetical protein
VSAGRNALKYGAFFAGEAGPHTGFVLGVEGGEGRGGWSAGAVWGLRTNSFSKGHFLC